MAFVGGLLVAGKKAAGPETPNADANSLQQLAETSRVRSARNIVVRESV